MPRMRRFFFRLWNLFWPQRAEQELTRELETHLALLADEFHRRGMSPDEACRAARRASDGVEQVKELHRDARSFAWLEDLQRDVVSPASLVSRSRSGRSRLASGWPLARRRPTSWGSCLGRVSA